MRQINLLPEQLIQAQKKSTIQKTLFATIGTTLCIMVGMHLCMTAWIKSMERRINVPRALQESQAGAEFKKVMHRRKKDLNVYVKKNKTVFDMVLNHVSTTNILTVIGDFTGDKVWLRQYSIDSGSKVLNLNGKSFSTRLVSEFMLELRRLPYFESVELITMGKGSGGELSIIDFQIVCRLK